MEINAKIYVAGHRGLVGSALVRRLKQAGYHNFVFRTSVELDLRDQAATRDFFELERPDYVFLAAAKVGGIHANSAYPADFIYDNLIIEANVIHESYRTGVRKLLFLGSSCIYPRLAPQPMSETVLLTGELEPTNEPYAIAKIAGIKLCQSYNRQYGANFISVMPTNLYGPGDNFDLENSHVLPAMICKFHEAKATHAPAVQLWGTGTPRREFLYVDDMADACLFLMERQECPQIVNIGTGTDLTIKELAKKIAQIVGYEGDITWDSSKPDGTPRKLLDVSMLQGMGWTHQVELEEGVKKTYEDALCQGSSCQKRK
ncbi:MAG: GDP-L-fucose synthase [Synergistaceae bacterium]|jgi:GDP-L-fucose synthase|nr:GDP-L-fucose synthase [Synergistaceae bacterium]